MKVSSSSRACRRSASRARNQNIINDPNENGMLRLMQSTVHE